MIAFFVVLVGVFVVHSGNMWRETQLVIARNKEYQIGTERMSPSGPPLATIYANAQGTKIRSVYEVPEWAREYLPPEYASMFKEELLESIIVTSDADMKKTKDLFDLSDLPYAVLKSKEITHESLELLAVSVPELESLHLQ